MQGSSAPSNLTGKESASVIFSPLRLICERAEKQLAPLNPASRKYRTRYCQLRSHLDHPIKADRFKVLLPAKTMSYVCVEGGGKEEERERNEIYIFIE